MSALGPVPYFQQSTSIFLPVSSSIFPLETSIFLESFHWKDKKKLLANFPHDLEKGALIRRGAHISTRRRKTLDGELNQANTSDWHAQLVD